WGSHEELFAVPTRRRAMLVVGPGRSVRDDPPSLMRRQGTSAPPQGRFVRPRTVRRAERVAGFRRWLQGQPAPARSRTATASPAPLARRTNPDGDYGPHSFPLRGPAPPRPPPSDDGRLPRPGADRTALLPA